MTLPNEQCPNCGCTGRTLWNDTGETTCSTCSLVIDTTYESPYDPERTRDLGKPGGQLFDPARLRRYSMSPRLARLQNVQERIPMFQLVERAIEESPFPPIVKDQALRVCRCIPGSFLSTSRLDTSYSSFGIDEKPTADQKNARREYRAKCLAWSVLALVDQAQPIGWRSTADINGIEVEKCLTWADGIAKQLGYEDEEGKRVRVTVTDILEMPRPTAHSKLDLQLEKLLTFLGNKHRLPHKHKESLLCRAWEVLNTWKAHTPMPSVASLAGKSAAQLAEMAVSIALLDLGYPRDHVREMHQAFPKGRMVKVRADILADKFAHRPPINSTSLFDDFSSLGGGWSV